LPVIVQGHFEDVVTQYNQYASLGNIGVILLEWTDNTDISQRHMPAHFLNKLPINKNCYTKDYIKDCFNLDDSRVYSIAVDELLNEDAGPLWRRLSTDLNLELPVADCNNIHSIWYSKFFK
jgi:hypothetical protein